MKNCRKTQYIWYQNVPYGLIKKTSTHTLCFCSFIRKLQTFEILRRTRGRGFSKWRSSNSFSSEQLMYYYLGKKYLATPHRSAVVFYLTFVQMHVLLNRSSRVVVILVGI